MARKTETRAPQARTRAQQFGIRTPRRLRVVVTAGPTREHLDPVRYLSNESSGRMGFAIAQAAEAAGHRVTLVAGPVALSTPPGVERIDVVSTKEMLLATLSAFRRADALFMAAAVSDWRPSRKLPGKWRAKDRAGAETRLSLIRNPDILAACGHDRTRKGKLVVGFALETASGISRARSKLKRKGADFIVLNDERALNAPRASVLILGGGGSVRRLENRTKAQIARELVGLLGRR